MIKLITEYGDPIPIVGKPGTVVLFHPNVVHGSGHNMSRHSRWQIYTVFNPVVNKPAGIDNPRPEWVVSRNYKSLPLGNDSDILGHKQAAE
jgi:ectoine hydroxylase